MDVNHGFSRGQTRARVKMQEIPENSVPERLRTANRRPFGTVRVEFHRKYAWNVATKAL
jgi:hypothetical protein